MERKKDFKENKKSNNTSKFYTILVLLIIIITMLVKFLTINERKSDNKHEYIKNHSKNK